MVELLEKRFWPVPKDPSLSLREFHTWEEWEVVIGRRVASAISGCALVPERLGPRGGWRYAVLFEEDWVVWARKFNERAFKQWQGKRAAKVARALCPNLPRRPARKVL